MVILRVLLFASGFIDLEISKRDYDYSKWLGPDYSKTKAASGSVSNHCSWVDSFIISYIFGGANFVSKSSNIKIPMMGKIGIATNTLFVDRAGTKEEKDKIVQQIEERQQMKIKEKGEGFNLHIFPEGFTTNNTHVLPFKRGAFASFLPLRPIAFKYSSKYFSPAHDIIPMGIHLVILLCQLKNSVEVTQLPVFEPNEYLYKNHMKEGEEKWMAYANGVRTCIADTLKLPISQATLKQKVECQDIYFKTKAQ
mmetsp:Transcript_21910/g.19452  ORF Transcript_21910/g.19452 Transcript_21910/m.19452 type:complete len:252 (+) Transcript_21910:363-1118(+)